MLKLAVAGSYDGDVVVRCVWIDAESLRDICDALRAESAFGIWKRVESAAMLCTSKASARAHTDVRHTTLSTTTILRKLSDNTERMSQLSLATAVLAIHLVDAHGLKATVEDAVPVLTAGGEAEALLAKVKQVAASHEAAFVGLCVDQRT